MPLVFAAICNISFQDLMLVIVAFPDALLCVALLRLALS